METQEFELKGKPYFIVQTEAGIFQVVKKLLISCFGFKEGAKYVCYNELLHLGLNIIEKSTRDISLLVKTAEKDPIAYSVIDDLRKFAEVSNYDYVAFESRGKKFAELISERDGYRYHAVKPRLFRRVVNN